MDFHTDQLDPDTDMDNLWDMEEVFMFGGCDILEAEDTISFKEWENPKLRINDNDDQFQDELPNANGVMVIEQWQPDLKKVTLRITWDGMPQAFTKPAYIHAESNYAGE